MAPHRVLLVSNRTTDVGLPSSIEQDSGRNVLAETTVTISDAVSRVAQHEYDAVVCWVEREDELAGVIRIRKTRPEQPILVFTSSLSDPSFEERARQAGAVRIVQSLRDDAAVSEHIRLAVQSGELRKQLKEQTQWARSQAREVLMLAQETGRLARSTRSVAGGRRVRFIPLVVEDDLDQAFLLLKAFQKADIYSPLPILRSAEEAIAYLSESAPGESRSWAESPTIILLDVEMPGKSGLEVLEWIRKQPRFIRLPVVMLSSSSNPEHVDQAYRLGANSYLLKPTSLTSLVEMVSSLKQYWGATNHSSDFP